MIKFYPGELITVEQLTDLSPCLRGIRAFEKMFPNGMPLRKKNLLRLSKSLEPMDVDKMVVRWIFEQDIAKEQCRAIQKRYYRETDMNDAEEMLLWLWNFARKDS